MKPRILTGISAMVLLAPLAMIPVRLVAQDNHDNKLITFDVPGKGTSAGQGTFASNIDSAAAISPSGAVTGPYRDASNVSHGFLRTPGGAFTTFDVPGAGTGPNQGTFPLSNNPAGATRDGRLMRTMPITASCEPIRTLREVMRFREPRIPLGDIVPRRVLRRTASPRRQ